MPRIVCPACSAAYVVPDTAIPPGGRDVQCAACGHDWFQLWLGEVPDTVSAWVNPKARESGQQVSSAVEGVGPDAFHFSGFGEASPSPSPLSQRGQGGSPLGTDYIGPKGHDRFQQIPEPDGQLGARGGAAGTLAADSQTVQSQPDSQANLPEEVSFLDDEPQLELPMPPRRRINPEVLAVLRREAEVETEARRIEATLPLESQGELPLPPQPRRSASEVRARLAKLQEAERQSGSGARWTRSVDLPSDPPESDTTPPAAQSVGFPPLPPMAKTPPAKSPAPQIDRTAIEPAAPTHTPRSRTLPAKVSSRELAAYQEQQTRRGFRIGFAIPVVAMAAALTLYLTAPVLLERMPAAEPALSALILHGDQMQERLAAEILGAFERLTSGGDT